MKWKIAESINKDFLDKHQDLNPVLLSLLWNRGITNDVDRFLHPDYSRDSHNPFLFNQMEEATDLVIQHIKEQNQITVYGDYDADGVTSSALMIELLTILRAKVDIYIPHRFKEGYGLNAKITLLDIKPSAILI